jgi:hypothetical protein
MDTVFWQDWCFAMLLLAALPLAPRRAKRWLCFGIAWVTIEMFWHASMERAVGKLLLLFCPY